tara:strand:- start:316 stop:804 length:489 start_codon:yes stop_codon:yes gene_type:complete
MTIAEKGFHIAVANAISLSMLPESCASATLDITPMSERHVSELLAEIDENARGAAFVRSFIGHADTAALVTSELRRICQPVTWASGFTIPAAVVPDLPASRDSFRFSPDGDDCLIVAQYQGPRLAEGATTLPDGASLAFFRVESRATFAQSRMAGDVGEGRR